MRYLFFLFFVMTLGFSACGGAQGQEAIAPKDFEKKIKGNTQLIDVRSPEEYASGHIPNFENINIAAVGFKDKMAKLDKLKPVFVYCAVGGRSAQAASMLRDMGFTEVYDLKGGIRAWANAGLPTIR